MTAATQIESGPQPARRSTMARPALMLLAATEYERSAALLKTLSASDWTRATACPGWDVRVMATHVLGMAEMAASIREGGRQMLAAKRAGGVFIDSLTARQVADRSGLSPAQLTERFRLVGPRAARARRRTPGFIRNRTMPVPQVVGGRPESWTMGFLIDTILTRDTWMHRIDIARATNRPLLLSADHDGLIVSDVVNEWAGRHRKACNVELTGLAGGSWVFGSDGALLELDAIDFCRTLSGRAPAEGLLSTEVPF